MSIHSIQEADALLLYKVGPIYVCSPTMQVEAVVLPPKFNVPPGSNESEPGMFRSLHGMVRVIDLRVRFGVDKEDRKSPGRIVIVEVEGGYAGFWVDEIEDVISFPEKGWAGVPAHIPRQVFSRTLTGDDHIRLYADFEQLDKFKAHGYLRKHIEYIKKDQKKKSDVPAKQDKKISSYESTKPVESHDSKAVKESRENKKETDVTEPVKPPVFTSQRDTGSLFVEKTENNIESTIGLEKLKTGNSEITSGAEKKPILEKTKSEVNKTRGEYVGGGSDGEKKIAGKSQIKSTGEISGLNRAPQTSEKYIHNYKSQQNASKVLKSEEGKQTDAVRAGNMENNKADISRPVLSSSVSQARAGMSVPERSNNSGIVWVAIIVLLLAGVAFISFEFFETGTESTAALDKPKRLSRPVQIDEVEEIENKELLQSNIQETPDPLTIEDNVLDEKEADVVEPVSDQVEITNIEKDILIVVHEYEEMDAIEDVKNIEEEYSREVINDEDEMQKDVTGDSLAEMTIAQDAGMTKSEKRSEVLEEVASNEDGIAALTEQSVIDESAGVQQSKEIQDVVDILSEEVSDEVILSGDEYAAVAVEPGKTIDDYNEIASNEDKIVELTEQNVIDESAGVLQGKDGKSVLEELPEEALDEAALDGSKSAAGAVEKGSIIDVENAQGQINIDVVQPLEKPARTGNSEKFDDKTGEAGVASLDDSAMDVTRTRKYIHIVVKGDTLWHIAKRYVNNPWRYPELARLSKIRNPDLIYPGQRIIIILNYK